MVWQVRVPKESLGEDTGVAVYLSWSEPMGMLRPVDGRVGEVKLSTHFEAQRMRSGPQMSNTELFTLLNLGFTLI